MSPQSRNVGGVRPWAQDIGPITDGELELFQALIHREAGIYLGPAKRGLLVGAMLKRVSRRGAFPRMEPPPGTLEERTAPR